MTDLELARLCRLHEDLDAGEIDWSWPPDWVELQPVGRLFDPIPYDKETTR